MLKKGSAAAKAFMAKLRAAKGKNKLAAKKSTVKKVGALPIGFEGNVFGIQFKIINQYDIYNDVSSIVENKKNGTKIVVFDGIKKAADLAQKFYDYVIDNTDTNPYGKDAKMLKSRILKFSQNLQKEVKDYNKGSKKTIKKQPLIIPLPAVKKTIAKETPKKAAAKKRTIKTGFSNREYDMRHQALAPGKRISKEGNKYTENRENRSDKGKLLGIAGINKEALALIADRKELLNDIQFRQIPLMQQESKLLKGDDKKRKLASIKYAREFMATLRKNIAMYKKHI